MSEMGRRFCSGGERECKRKRHVFLFLKRRDFGACCVFVCFYFRGFGDSTFCGFWGLALNFKNPVQVEEPCWRRVSFFRISKDKKKCQRREGEAGLVLVEN